jgi:hypothetical protein
MGCPAADAAASVDLVGTSRDSAIPPPDLTMDQAMSDLVVPDQSMAMPDQSMAMLDQSMAVPDQSMAVPDQSMIAFDLSMPVPDLATIDLVGALDLGGTCSMACTIGASPASAVLRDFDGDGALDLAIADRGNGVELLSGAGDGTFRPMQIFAAGTGPEDIDTADFDGDGKLDVVTANKGSGDVTVLRNLGNGSFAAPVATAAGASARAIAAGDWNGDGKPDLAAAVDSGTAILLGKGGGAFQPATIVPLDPDRFEVATPRVRGADLNGDGKLDLVTTDERNSGPPTVHVVEIHLGNGDGTFQPGTSILHFAVCNLGFNAFGWIGIADIDKDGQLDLVAEDIYNCAGIYSHEGSYFPGKGDGTFLPRVVVPVLTLSHQGAVFGAATLADFDGDGRLDLAATDGVFAATVVNFAAGKADQRMQLPLDPAMRLAGGDLDKDGKAELVVLTPNQLTVLHALWP